VLELMFIIFELLFQEFILLLVYRIYLFHVDISDINECIAGTDDCSVNSACINTAGSYDCRCNSGFADVLGDGTQCDGKNCN